MVAEFVREMQMSTHSEKLLESMPASLDIPIQEDPISTSFSLSVLVPVYNERYLAEASLRRVLALKDAIIHSLEVIIVDDCSTDGSWEILQRVARDDDRMVLLRHERNMGKGAAVRTALAHEIGRAHV